MKKLTNVYICHTYYHVLISIIKTLKSNQTSDIVLAGDMKNSILANDSLLIKKIEDSKLFGDIYVFDYTKQLKITKLYNLKQLFFLRKIIKEKKCQKLVFNLYKYDNIYIFNDQTLIGLMLNLLKLPYNLLEDGMDCFKCCHRSLLNYNKNIFRKKIKKFLKIYDRCESPYIRMIEVNDKNDIFIKHFNIVECSKKEIFNSLNSKEKDIILKIFCENIKEISNLSNSILILTQPFFEDKICSTEEEKVNLYKKIVLEYGCNNNVIIKTHPRENTNYLNYFKNYKNVNIITDIFPVEVLNFLDIRFKKVITITSTAINIVENSDCNLSLGYEYITNNLE